MSLRIRGCLLVVLASALACAKPGVFRPDGYHNELYGYSIHYSDAAARAFVSSDWVVDNYFAGPDGLPGKAKSDEDYRRERTFELDNGAKHTAKIDIYDLRLVHKKSSAVLWVRTVVLEPRDRERDLRVLMQEYAEELSGTGFFATDVGKIKIGARQFATKITEARPTTLAGFEAFDGTIEIANVDQLRLDPASRSDMVRVIFARTPYVYSVEDGYTSAKLPVLLVVGYLNNPTDFARQQPDFDRLLTLVDGSSAVQAPQPGAPAPAAASAPAASAAPAVPAPSASVAR
jgi:hypothetical protein